ncbi:YbaK/EbsC family protein [Candidatus Dojkabacteria bacterium]|nr:YbaK/EbsC family protein [Candidatus Dojkabacteria bacterium]
MAYSTFQKYIKDNGIDLEIIVTDEPTKTAEQASQVHGVPVSNIVKSLLVNVEGVFKLFLVPGDRRLDFEEIKRRFNAKDVRMANADEVKDITGYSIGGVPPFGHTTKLVTYVEEGFNKEIELVAAAGSGNSVFKIGYEKLREIIS